LPLTPDLAAGTYHVVLRDQEEEVALLGLIELDAARPLQALVVAPEQPLDLPFGEHIRLIGYDLPDQLVAPGNYAVLTLYWRTDAVLTIRYKVFTHLLGSTWNAEQGSFLWGQQDNEPQGDQWPTTRWVPGEVVVDRYRIKVDPQAPAGAYQLEVGMYGLLDGTRLTTGGELDAVILGQVEVR
jgi:hypothetical protein